MTSFFAKAVSRRRGLVQIYANAPNLAHIFYLGW